MIEIFIAWKRVLIAVAIGAVALVPKLKMHRLSL